MLMLASLLGLAAVGGMVLMSSDAEDELSDEEGGGEGLVPEPEAELAVEQNSGAATGNETGDLTEYLVLPGTDDADAITGGEGDDQINGYDADDTLSGQDGRDTIYGSAGADRIDGDAGDDLLHGEDDDDTLDGGDGDDSLFGHFGADLLQGGAGQDNLHGGQDNDRLDGDADNDALHGGHGDDTLTGGTGEDSLFGGFGNDVISGIEGTNHAPLAASEQDVDYLNGGDGQDTIFAGAGDIVTTGAGEDAVFAGHWVTDGAPVQIMDFEPGVDQLQVIWNTDSDADPAIEISKDPDNPGLTRVSVEGEQVAVLHSESEVLPSDILLIRENVLAQQNWPN
ncbi:calcium-binding protein [Ruegeria aquimaris]|uniref:Calcium-binding protein n=1 Tax=Ruegeria aquimaris TaxID=2984333 RepID=A0ABT3AFD7_9RHOB|nr:calcium-binding protein [Ruegeria sp. XHP0148]MCV2887389.1 calcium-binding protein [Ruegeria sp. XHP0148]